MYGGVSFQPGSSQLEQEVQHRRGTGRKGDGVQEAIKVLSLRLPKVVGAQAVSPSALLKSPGSGGNPDYDSMIQKVLARVFPGQGSPAPAAPMIPSQATASQPMGSASP